MLHNYYFTRSTTIAVQITSYILGLLIIRTSQLHMLLISTETV